jgi:hypothetical protein
VNYKRVFFYLTVILAAAVIWFVRERSEDRREREIERFVDVYAGLATVTEIYAEHPELLERARDSIFDQYHFSVDSIRHFRGKYAGHEERWAKIWDRIQNRIDSLATAYQNNPPPLPQKTGDSSAAGEGNGI